MLDTSKKKWYILSSRVVGSAQRIRKDILKYLDKDDELLDIITNIKEEINDVSDDIDNSAIKNIPQSSESVQPITNDNEDNSKYLKSIMHDRVLNRWKKASESIEEVFVPVVIQNKIAKNKKKLEKNMVPGYIFIKMERNIHTEAFLKFISMGLRIIGNATQKEIDVMKEGLKKVDSIESQDYVIGTKIEIIEGPFESFVGNIESIDNQNASLKVAVMIFGRNTTVELSFQQVKLIE